MTKTLISEFFTTISFSIHIRTAYLMTLRLPKLRYWDDVEYVENQLLSYITDNNSKIISFYNWRSAIYHCLKLIWVEKYDEVIVSWYNCISVSNAVIQSWAKIIYSDINQKNLWLDLVDLESKINENTKVIIVQHTFWKPSDIVEIIKVANKNNILVIEDCAHSLWSRVNWKKLGSFWDFSIFSTWRDKVISSVTWGFLIINNESYFNKIDEVKNKLKMPSRILVLKNLFYNISAYKAYKTYDFFKLWRVVIYLSRKFNLITEILTSTEKNCNFNEFNYKLPNSLAYLTSKELVNIKLISNHRASIAEFYDWLLKNKRIKILFKLTKKEKNNYFRYPILVKSEKTKNELYNYMRKNDIILWNTWSWINIVPIWSNLKKAKYIIWNCPIAEDISKRILTLPNHNYISAQDAKKVVELLNNY